MRNQMTVKWKGSGVISTLPNDQPRKRLMDQSIERQRFAHRFYVYAFLRKDGTPYYIGKGQGDRINDPKSRRFKLPPKDQRKILAGGLTEPESFEYEIALISLLGRKDLGTGCLRNLTDGGEGTSGAVLSPETRAKISAANKGRIKSPETCAKLSAAHKGRVFSAETLAKMSAAHSNPSPETRAKISAANSNRSAETRAKLSAAAKGRTHSAEVRAKMSATRKGRKHSAEHSAKIGAAQKGRIFSSEHRAKLSAAHKGHNPSPETRAKLSAAAAAREAAKRALREDLGGQLVLL